MSITRYIRPMSFGETVGSMFRLYGKIFISIIGMNLMIIVPTLGFFTFFGLYVGPVLVMTSNAILGKQVSVLESIRKGIFSISFLKIVLVAVGYYILIVMIMLPSYDADLDFTWVGFVYIFLTPLWIFIPMIILLEKKGLLASIKRSFQILGKNFGRTLQMDIFFTLILMVASFLLSAVSGGAVTISDSVIVAVLLATISGFSSLPYVFVYYEYRARYENYSEELLTEEMGYQPMEEMMNV